MENRKCIARPDQMAEFVPFSCNFLSALESFNWRERAEVSYVMARDHLVEPKAPEFIEA